MKKIIFPAARRAVNRFERAVASMAFKGASDPDDHAAIEKEYRLARENLLKYLPIVRTRGD